MIRRVLETLLIFANFDSKDSRQFLYMKTAHRLRFLDAIPIVQPARILIMFSSNLLL